MIKESTQILNSSASCIDLTFTSQLNLVMHSELDPSLQPNCHHQTVFAKFKLEVYYPPSSGKRSL